MILIMMIKIMLKTMIKHNKLIKFMDKINNNNNHINSRYTYSENNKK